MNRVIVLGGYGVFGGHVARVLAAQGVPLTIAGRDGVRATAFARTLGADCRALAVDVTQPESCRAALTGHTVAINCAGPFSALGSTLLETCLDTGCHYADIADDRAYAAQVRSYGTRFEERGLAAVYGCSSLPGISGALALRARHGTTSPVRRVRVTLFIGNDNPKGAAAVASLLTGLGQPIAAPQGTLRGFHDREVVPLPPPFGPRGVFNFESPEYDLFPARLGASAVAVKVGFELRLATYGFALLARTGAGRWPWLRRLLTLPERALRGIGCSGGAVMSELFLADGTVRRAAVAGRVDGQRMAALPCALVARSLARGGGEACGVLTAYDLLGADTLLGDLQRAGFALYLDPASDALNATTPTWDVGQRLGAGASIPEPSTSQAGEPDHRRRAD